MKIDPTRAQTLVSQLAAVKDKVASAANGRNVSALFSREGILYTNAHVRVRGVLTIIRSALSLCPS